jgi:hypothetical protein
VERTAVTWQLEGLRKEQLRVPESVKHQAEVLPGVDDLVRVLDELGILS